MSGSISPMTTLGSDERIGDRIGERVAARRRALALTQAELARAAGIGDPQTVSNVERCRQTPGLPVLRGLARALGVTIDWLVDARAESGAALAALDEAGERHPERRATLCALAAAWNLSATDVALIMCVLEKSRLRF
jgi:DNA-binding XRE family transcriptional regulator